MVESSHAPRLPSGWMRDVYGNEDARGLMDLVGAKGPTRYADARRNMGLRPAEFQRAIEKLERHGLLQVRAPTPAGGPGRQVVFLELSGLGRIAHDVGKTIDASLGKVLEAQGVPPKLAEALLKEA